MTQACRGVEAAHAAGIVHRDLKPHNLFLCRRDDGTDLVKVLDFGVAKLQAIEASNAATDTGTVLGTAAYMSPEQARGEKMVDHRADVYALGAILYELLSQKKPHPGDSQNAILHHIATQPAVPLASVQRGPDGLAAELVDVIGRTLASDPGARPQTAAALATALAPFAGREVWPAAPALATPDKPAPMPARERVRTRGALIAALALASIAVAAGALWRGGRTPETGRPDVQATAPPPPPCPGGHGARRARPRRPGAGPGRASAAGACCARHHRNRADSHHRGVRTSDRTTVAGQRAAAGSCTAGRQDAGPRNRRRTASSGADSGSARVRRREPLPVMAPAVQLGMRR